MALFIAALVLAYLVAGCATSDEEENLPARRVKTVTFPVRPLEFNDVSCRQEKEQFNLSGSLKNISFSPLSNVQVRAEVIFAGDLLGQPLSLPLNPPLLPPGQSGTFSLVGTVSRPISHIELHAQWEDFYPPGL
jgi:hypothetical protein